MYADFSLFLCIFRPQKNLEDDSDFEQEDYDVRSRTSVQTEDDQLIAGQSTRVRVDIQDFGLEHSGCVHQTGLKSF